jgi:hypothetical protein
MVSFAPVLSPAEAEAIRAYVIKRANDTYEATTAQPTSRRLLFRASAIHYPGFLGAIGFDVGCETPGACRVVSNS